MPIPDTDLVSELTAFAKRFGMSFTYPEIASMLEDNRDVHEYHNENDEATYFEVEATPTYSGSDDRGEYIAVLFGAMDLREKGLSGSAYSPLSFFGFLYKDGYMTFGPFGTHADSKGT